MGEAEPQTAGVKLPYAPLMPPLMISSLRYKCPPESKLIYEYREKKKNLENSVRPSTEFPVSLFSTFNRRDLNFRDP